MRFLFFIRGAQTQIRIRNSGKQLQHIVIRIFRHFYYVYFQFVVTLSYVKQVNTSLSQYLSISNS